MGDGSEGAKPGHDSGNTVPQPVGGGAARLELISCGYSIAVASQLLAVVEILEERE